MKSAVLNVVNDKCSCKETLIEKFLRKYVGQFFRYEYSEMKPTNVAMSNVTKGRTKRPKTEKVGSLSGHKNACTN